MSQLLKGSSPEIPDTGSARHRMLLARCWQLKPELRPSFIALSDECYSAGTPTAAAEHNESWGTPPIAGYLPFHRPNEAGGDNESTS